ncbi:hypothetical protein [Streptomyces sp. MMBL 11-3]|uniref:hypothetical protein n=1 Tax=Streptomyces sp. MMBL 11-3 TaxID=3382639 RepID=UPI0039B50491
MLRQRSEGLFEGGEAVEGGGQQGVVAGVGRCRLGDQGYAGAVGQLRAFQTEFGTVDRALPGAFTAGGRLGDAAVGAQAVEFEADHAVVGGEREQPQALHHAVGDPLVAASAQGGGRAVRVGGAFVSAAEDQDLHQPVEDDGVADARVVTAQRVPVLAHGQEREELVADRVENA